MEILSVNDAEILINQLQQSHRLCVGFYKRFLLFLDEIATRNLGLEYYFWETMYTDLPPKSRTNPSLKWAWDFVPLYASRFCYKKHAAANKVLIGDIGVSFMLHIDDAFMLGTNKQAGEPDPLMLPKGRAILRALVYRPKSDYQISFDEWWELEDSLEVGSGEWASVNEFSEGVALEWSLADVMSDKLLPARDIQSALDKRCAAAGS